MVKHTQTIRRQRRVFDHFVVLALKGLKLVSAIFYQIFIFHQMIALQKLKNVFYFI